SRHEINFAISDFDAARTLVIDPVVSYATYIGGIFTDIAMKVAVDASGSAYVTGATVSANFPTSSGALKNGLSMSICHASNAGKPFPCPDAFVTKLNAAGTAALYSTYLGGSSGDFGIGIAVDSAGNAYVTGETESTDFPTTTSGFQH